DLPPSPPPAHPSAEAGVQDKLPALARAGSPWAQAELGIQLLYGRCRPANQPCGLCWLAKAAQAGDLGAMLGLSQWFMARTPSYNLALSHFWFTKALSTGSTLALERAGDAVLALNLGPEAVQKAAMLYKTGSISSPNCLAKLLDLRVKGRLGKLSLRDRRACVDRLAHLAKAGSLHALRAMGEFCLESVHRTGKACIGWLSAAAERGDRTCQRKLALLLAGSKTGRKAMAAPWHWMELAAEEDPEAQYVVGVWLAAGRGCKADPRRAEHYLRLASAALPKALVQLGILLAGDADAGRRAEGTAMLVRAASLGLSEACFELGNMALAERNVEEAALRFHQAGRHAPSLRRLGEMALDEARAGKGDAKLRNEDSAWQLMAQAASLDDAEAMLAMARHKLSLAEQAKGSASDALIGEACGFLKDACRKGHPQALHELALLAAQGAPGAPEPAQAMKLHAKAASLGHVESMVMQAKDLLDQARQAAKGRQGPATKGYGLVRGGRAAAMLRRAADLGSATSALLYGILLEEGIFVRRDWRLALSCVRKAALAGVSEGHYHLGLLLLKMGADCEAEGWSALAKAAELGHADARTGMARRCLACGDPRLAGGWLDRHL
ncbi:MAG: sel1 repeat family protein, partial [Desulfovibrio sp.]|nr:sel1 repeat family protein [Desulfovibrio sp.]